MGFLRVVDLQGAALLAGGACGRCHDQMEAPRRCIFCTSVGAGSSAALPLRVVGSRADLLQVCISCVTLVGKAHMPTPGASSHNVARHVPQLVGSGSWTLRNFWHPNFKIPERHPSRHSPSSRPRYNKPLQSPYLRTSAGDLDGYMELSNRKDLCVYVWMDGWM